MVSQLSLYRSYDRFGAGPGYRDDGRAEPARLLGDRRSVRQVCQEQPVRQVYNELRRSKGGVRDRVEGGPSRPHRIFL